MKNFDVIVVGAGIVGLTLARALLARGQKNLAILEKEAELGVHSSGRNSGVLHAGIYYATDSVKAKVCAKGSRLLQEYAAERGIGVKKLGKVIVAQRPELAPQIDLLYRRALDNGIRVEKVDEAELRRIEPWAVSHGAALFSPDTAVIDSRGVLDALEQELTAAGVPILKSSGVLAVDAERRCLATAEGELGYGHFFNAAGLHADEIAHWCGVGERYRILPFKGIYKKLAPEAAAKFRGSIYPVPDLEVPFLGVHVTRSVFDEVTVGPTAIPAFGRENYYGWRGLSPLELPVMALDLASMLLKNEGGFRRMVFEELGKYGAAGYLRCVQELVPSLEAKDILPSGKVGLRAQLIDEREMRLEMDFIVEPGPASTHVLNAVSPAFTSSMAFADFVLERSPFGSAPK